MFLKYHKKRQHSKDVREHNYLRDEEARNSTLKKLESKIEGASKRRLESVNRTLEKTINLSHRRQESPVSALNRTRPISRGAQSKASGSNISRLSIDSNLVLKRRDSFDDIAKALLDIEQRYNTSKSTVLILK
jgi:hypothetical protein